MKKVLQYLIIATLTFTALFTLQTSTASAAGDKPNFSWPAEGEITAKFHDKTYPFKSLFQHAGIDIAIEQGSEVQAAGAGEVLVIKRPKSDAYSYVLIAHKNRMATVYGHLSEVNVKKGDKVQKGDVIGLSGGEPSTNGAGNYSTGAHLHFEVRKAGIPVNPLKYLQDSN